MRKAQKITFILSMVFLPFYTVAYIISKIFHVTGHENMETLTEWVTAYKYVTDDYYI